MKKYVRITVLSFAFFSLLMSCTKEKTEPTKSLTVEEMLTAKWQATAKKGIVPLLDSIDLFSSTIACKKDDFKDFKKDGQLLFDEGTTKCISGSVQFKTGSWVLSTDKKKMTIKEPGEDDTIVDILQLTTTTLKVRYTGITGFPTVETYTKIL
ncbi:MAG: hypothetical protein V4714_12005 [Bacteroidota bacterium]